jgi:hypothetical protein
MGSLDGAAGPGSYKRAMAAVAQRKTKGSLAAGGGGAKTKRRRKTKVLPPLLSPGTAVEVLRNGKWVGGGTVTIRNDRTYMVSLPEGMTVLMTRGRVRPTAGYGTLYW